MTGDLLDANDDEFGRFQWTETDHEVYDACIDIPLDEEFGPLALKVDGGFAVELKYSYDLIWGLSVSDYIYMGTNDKTDAGDPVLEVEIGAFLDGEPLNNASVTPFYAEGKFLFFIISVEDIDRDPEMPNFQPSGILRKK